MRSSTSLRHSRGQAMIETLVACLLLIPLWIAVHYLTRWHDLQFTTLNAARYAAFASWSAGGREPAPHISAITVERLYSRDVERFRAAASRDAARRYGEVAQWRHLATGESLLDPQQRARIELAAVAPPARTAAVEEAAFSLIEPAEAAGRGRFDLARNAAVAAVAATPLRIGAEAHAASVATGGLLQLRARQVLMVDSWISRDSAAVARRTLALSVASRMPALTLELWPVRWAIREIEPAFERLCLGRIAPEIVPPDRLVGGTRAGADLRTVACP